MRFVKHRLSRWLVPSITVICIASGIVTWYFSLPEGTQVVEATASQAMESNEPIQPIEPLPSLDPRKINLGHKLFDDPRLSHNNQVSCTSCHNLKSGGTDRLARSIGINGALGVINAPTVLNSGFNFNQFWDGRADTLENKSTNQFSQKWKWAQVGQR